MTTPTALPAPGAQPTELPIGLSFYPYCEITTHYLKLLVQGPIDHSALFAVPSRNKPLGSHDGPGAAKRPAILPRLDPAAVKRIDQDFIDLRRFQHDSEAVLILLEYIWAQIKEALA